ncbi:protein polyglycylase TTLL10 isoform X2 [Denticeps clupeoides]|uniref:protein polyglycylase TTLL10 isoform X2 n=1 Tax=Denticeps clupeoides TaxID=299321 RepID=UPI0010A32AA0|nr:inactive polyglycylase TTLL10 isoform X2 [Denticeps clupeoides]
MVSKGGASRTGPMQDGNPAHQQKISEGPGGAGPVSRGQTEVVGPGPGAGAGIRVSCKVQRQSRGPHIAERRSRHAEDPCGTRPFFFIGGANGAAIVSSYCESKGWQRIYDKSREDYRLKWCETKSPTAYWNFREGEQLLYQIPNNKVLTTKIGLLASLTEYERVISKVNHGRGIRRLKIEEFLPSTFRMDVRDEREAFFSKLDEGDETNMWICKPTGLNQGRGIFLLRTKEDLAAFRSRLQNLSDSHHNKFSSHPPQARIVQWYIQNPLLLSGRKFDVRSYFLIACTSPYMLFFRHGYVRLTCDLYDPTSNNLSNHLTNQYMQKKHPLYSVLKEETVWSMERFNTYVNENFMTDKGLPKDWVLGFFARRMQQVIVHCFMAVKTKLERKLGLFDLIGCDFLIDEDFKVWLLEMNCNPALHINCEVLKEVVPNTLTEALDLTLEIFTKRLNKLHLLPLDSQRDFVLLYSGEETPGSPRRSTIARPCQTLWPKSSQALKNTKKLARGQRTATVSKPGKKSMNAPISGSPATHSPHNPPPACAIKTGSLHQGPQIRFSGAPVTNGTHKVLRTPRPPKHALTRVELQLRKCTWHDPLSACQDGLPHQPLQTRSAIVSTSAPAISEDLGASKHSWKVRPVRLHRGGRPLPVLRPINCRRAHLQARRIVWQHNQDAEVEDAIQCKGEAAIPDQSS